MKKNPDTTDSLSKNHNMTAHSASRRTPRCSAGQHSTGDHQHVVISVPIPEMKKQSSKWKFAALALGILSAGLLVALLVACCAARKEHSKNQLGQTSAGDGPQVQTSAQIEDSNDKNFLTIIRTDCPGGSCCMDCPGPDCTCLPVYDRLNSWNIWDYTSSLQKQDKSFFNCSQTKENKTEPETEYQVRSVVHSLVSANAVTSSNQEYHPLTPNTDTGVQIGFLFPDDGSPLSRFKVCGAWIKKPAEHGLTLVSMEHFTNETTAKKFLTKHLGVTKEEELDTFAKPLLEMTRHGYATGSTLTRAGEFEHLIKDYVYNFVRDYNSTTRLTDNNFGMQHTNDSAASYVLASMDVQDLDVSMGILAHYVAAESPSKSSVCADFRTAEDVQCTPLQYPYVFWEGKVQPGTIDMYANMYRCGSAALDGDGLSTWQCVKVADGGRIAQGITIPMADPEDKKTCTLTLHPPMGKPKTTRFHLDDASC